MSNGRVTGSLAAEQRRKDLAEILAREGSIELSDVATRYGVHEMTVRRDLEFLEKSGAARRVRGGAVVAEGDAFSQRMLRSRVAKRGIAQKLLPLLPASGAIGVDASTTLMTFAESIRSPRLSVLTNGMPTFDTLRSTPGIRAILTGGESEEHNASLVGPLAIQAVTGFHLDRSFLSTTSIEPDFGTSEPTLPQVEVKRAMVEASSHVILAVDSSKLGTRSAVRALSLSSVDMLVTELDPADERLDPYRDSLEIL